MSDFHLTAGFLAEIYGPIVNRSMAKEVAIMQRMSYSEYDRRSHWQFNTSDEEWDEIMGKRKALYESIMTTIKDLQKDGVLQEDSCYECSGLPEINAYREGHIVYDETEKEWEARVAKLPPYVTFQKFKRAGG